TNDFPRADIRELIAPDLHQLIKGCFKDHLVDWAVAYIRLRHTPKKEADRVLDGIDRRIAAVASFSGLRRFPQGLKFKQWTGDDSKALTKVSLIGLSGLHRRCCPSRLVRTLRAFLELCYIARRHAITNHGLEEMQDALGRFRRYRKVFVFQDEEYPAAPAFSLPRQHAAKHCPEPIRLFGAPSGLCSSITENKHIKAVKEPRRRSSEFNALGRMPVTSQRLDKLAAARVDFTSRGMLVGICLDRQAPAFRIVGWWLA
ncbi:hypothetical protein EV363DRAFT_1203314, partial [Boletus edulis]